MILKSVELVDSLVPKIENIETMPEDVDIKQKVHRIKMSLKDLELESAYRHMGSKNTSSVLKKMNSIEEEQGK